LSDDFVERRLAFGILTFHISCERLTLMHAELFLHSPCPS